MIGYAIYNLFDDWIEYSVVKTDPEYLNTQVNAALAYFGVERYMRPGIKYIHGGWRTMIHEMCIRDRQQEPELQKWMKNAILDSYLNMVQTARSYQKQYRKLLDKRCRLYTSVKTGGKPPKDRFNLFATYYDTIKNREKQKDALESLHDSMDWIDDIHYEIAYKLQKESQSDSNPSAAIGRSKFRPVSYTHLIFKAGRICL